MTSFLSPNPPRCRCSSSTVAASQPSHLIFSDGTAFNGVVQDLMTFTTRVARVLGGPAVGDIRLRCLRLADQSTAEAVVIRQLLGHRLPIDAHQAKSEGCDCVRLWKEITRGGAEF